MEDKDSRDPQRWYHPGQHHQQDERCHRPEVSLEIDVYCFSLIIVIVVLYIPSHLGDTDPDSLGIRRKDFSHLGIGHRTEPSRIANSQHEDGNY